MRIVLVSRNRYLWQKIRLLRPSDEVTLTQTATDDFDKLIWDADTAEGIIPAEAITLSRTAPAMLDAAFSEGELGIALGECGAERISVEENSRTVMLDGMRIKLTEVEFALFFELYRARGCFVPREKLISAVWGDIGNDSLINVYIHYLREKLERGAEKIIFSSRREGYKLELSARVG